MKAASDLPIAIIYSQFAAYHMDRCEAVAQRLAGRNEVLAIEVATTSSQYAWEASGELKHAKKITLFPGKSFEAISPLSRFWAQFRVLRKCGTVFVGIPYNLPDIIALSWILPLFGVRMIVMNDSKFDDRERSVYLELFKVFLLATYSGALVAGRRQAHYFRFLRFFRRPVVPGYDCVSMARIRAQSGNVLAPHGKPHAERDFIFVGRFVEKKNLLGLIRGFGQYVSAAGDDARKLVLVGSGHLQTDVDNLIADLGLQGRVEFPGFLTTEQVAMRLSQSLALFLVSTEEQWGLVVNEALAFGLPVVVSNAVGARDVLVRNYVTGFVVDCEEGIAQAMQSLASDRVLWERMVAASHERAWMGDVERIADATEYLLDPVSEPAASRVQKLRAEIEI